MDMDKVDKNPNLNSDNDWFVFIPDEERRAFENAYEKMRQAKQELVEMIKSLELVSS